MPSFVLNFGLILQSVSNVPPASRLALMTPADARSRNPSPSSIAPNISVQTGDGIMIFSSSALITRLSVGGWNDAAWTREGGSNIGAGSASTSAACWVLMRTRTGADLFFDQRLESSIVCGSMPTASAASGSSNLFSETISEFSEAKAGGACGSTGSHSLLVS